MKILKHVTIIAALALAGCATPEYGQYATAQSDIARAKAGAETARYAALSEIAKTGDPTSRVAAVMALALGNGNTTNTSVIQAPPTNQALAWASIVVPGITSIAGFRYSYLGAKVASDNATALGISTNGTFLGMAQSIQAPGAITTLSGTGTMGGGSYTIIDDHTYNTAPVVPPVVVVPPVINQPVVIVPDPAAP